MPIRSSTSSGDGPSLFPRPSSGIKTSAAEWISAHCDGGARGNPGPAGYGAQIKDASGEVIAELSEFLGIRTNNYAEYSGLLGCLAWALEHGHRRLRMVSDSELMVKQIQGKYQVKSPDLKPLFDEAKRRIARLDGFEISHALRHKNKDADRLANDAMDLGMSGGTKRVASPHQEAVPPATRPPTQSPAPPAGRATPIAVTQRPAMQPATPLGTMLRGFTRDGVVHVLGGVKLPEGVFVKIVLE